MELSRDEIELIKAYRQKPREVQEMILRGLGIKYHKKILSFECKASTTGSRQDQKGR